MRQTNAITRRELIQRSGLTAGALLLPEAQSAAESPGAPTADEAPLPAGVKAVWDIELAHAEKTPTRERVCLNGLWRWQPVQVSSNTPPAGGWGWFKAPGSWPGITDYLQKDCQTVFPHDNWKSVSLRDTSRAWYQREITISEDWKSRRITLSLEYVNTFATVYIDGGKAGEIRFPTGELDISTLCKPGKKHALSIFVQSAPLKAVMLSYTDTNAAAREVKGSVERRGLCGDVWLIGEPRSARITDIKIDTSVSTGQISFDVAVDGLTPGAAYTIQPQISDAGRIVHEGTLHRLTAAGLKDGRITVTEAWKPDKLWDTHTPQNQYTATLSLMGSSGLMDRAIPVRFGYREFLIKGKDFYLNGTRIFLHTEPLNNAQIGAAWASYQGAKETFVRFKGLGINFLYMGNYSCEPGVHLGFAEILRAADDAGMLISFTQPHFSNYDWKAPDADKTNGYAIHAEWYVRAAQNHPSVVCYAMSHNATGYVEEANPDMIDGIQQPVGYTAGGNAALALRAEAIVKRFDTSRVIYHHSSGNLGSMHTCNFYVNFAPAQELSDWFEHWEKNGVKPLFLCEYGCPYSWDWTMYRGWYKGNREWGSAKVPWEFCSAEWNAQFVGDTAYKIGEREKANLRWEADRFKHGEVWYRWDYPTFVGSSDFPDTNTVYRDYLIDNTRAHRTRGVSAFGPAEYQMFWQLKGSADRSRKQLPVDWDHLQRPGFSADYIDDRPPNLTVGFERSDWLPTPAGNALLLNNMPLLAYIAGKDSAVSSKDHIYQSGETIEKLLIIINNSRETVSCDCTWSLGPVAPGAGSVHVMVATGEQARIPIKIPIPANTDSARLKLEATVRFSTGDVQHDSFDIQLISKPPALSVIFSPGKKIALYDPKGETARALTGLTVKTVTAADDLAGYDLLIIGKEALTREGPGPDLSPVKDGLKVIMMEQTAEALEQRLGFRVAEYGMRQVFPLLRNSLLLAGMNNDGLRDWRGDATLLPQRLKYTIGNRYSPQVKWCGLDVTRVWRCGCRGNVASVLIEKPACGDFKPILNCGYGLQYSPLMEYREGSGMVLFCQMDVTGRTEHEPAAALLFSNILRYASDWQPTEFKNSAVYYVGEPAGFEYFNAAGIVTEKLPKGRPPARCSPDSRPDSSANKLRAVKGRSRSG